MKKYSAQSICIRTGIGLLSMALFACLAGSTRAATLNYQQFVGALTIAEGFTAQNANDSVRVIFPDRAFNRSFHVELVRMTAQDSTPKTPLDKDMVSGIYSYGVLPAVNNELEQPIIISMRYPAQETRWREIYMYDFENAVWNHIPGSIDLENHLLSIRTTKASGLIVALADHVDKSEYIKDKINAPSIYVADANTGEVLLERASDLVRPVASLTKLMTASVFLDHNPGWGSKISMIPSDDTIPSKIYAKTGETFTTQSLFFATLLKSANNAARALARSTNMPDTLFAEEMNKKARELGMANTRYAEPTGLSEKNVSTAQDYYKLAKNNFANLTFLQATTPQKLVIKSIDLGRKHTLENSNKAMDVPYVIIGQKTGYTHEAGRCIVVKARNRAGREVIAVILGATEPGAQWNDIRLALDAALGDSTAVTVAAK